MLIKISGLDIMLIKKSLQNYKNKMKKQQNRLNNYGKLIKNCFPYHK